VVGHRRFRQGGCFGPKNKAEDRVPPSRVVEGLVGKHVGLRSMHP
jgi:hypothetical protein